MKTKLTLASKTPKKWVNTVLDDFDSFLLAAADSERKNVAYAQMLVAKYPQYAKCVGGWIEIAQVDLNQFRELYRLIEERGLKMGREISKDLYINRVVMHCRNGRRERFVDRMIVAGLILLRGAERYRMLAEAVTDAKQKKLFNTFADEDTNSADVYVDLLSLYFGKEEINERIKVLTAGEAEVTREMELEASLH